MTARRVGFTQPASPAARRLLRVAAGYIGVAIIGVGLSLVYDVGAEPGGDPASDLVLRGTALAAPLYLPVLLVPAAALARTRSRAGAVGAAVAGLAGIALMLGGTFNLANDLDAARAAGSPPALSVVFGLGSATFGLVLAANAALAIAARLRGGAIEPSAAVSG